MRLTGDLSEYYDVLVPRLRAGLRLARLGQRRARAGTTGIGYRVEALQVRVLAKGSAAPGPDGRRVQGPPIASEFGCSQRPLYNAEPRASDWLRVRCIDQCA